MLCREKLVMCPSGFYECNICDYSSIRKENYRRHLLSAKHSSTKERVKVKPDAPSASNIAVPVAAALENEFVQEGLPSGAAPSLRDGAPSKFVQDSYSSNMVKPVTLTDVMEMFMKHTEMFMKHQETTQIQNTDMFKALTNRIIASQASNVFENSKNNTVNATTNNTTNNNNNKKKFKLNFFLNEECKNAMNLSDFIQNLVVNMEDLEHICEVGYTQGMSKIITKAMNGTRKTERPIHCSDSKRETMYVRKDDAWQKDANKEECERLIKHIGSKNYKFMSKWCEDNPGYQVSDSSEYEKWYSITRELCNTDPKAMKRLIHHLALATEIEKDDDSVRDSHDDGDM